MKCYIQIVNGLPHEHPIVEWNFKQAFPDIDVNNLPPEYCPFVRVGPPVLGPYEKNQTVSYGLVEGMAGTYTDIWTCEEMTSEEKTAKQQSVKDEFAVDYPTYASWTFDEATCSMVPPVPYPSDPSSNRFTWNEENQIWDALPNPSSDSEEES